MTKQEWAEILVHELKVFPKVVAIVTLVIIWRTLTGRHGWSEFDMTGCLNAGLTIMMYIYILRVIAYTVGAAVSEIIRIRKKNSS